MGGNASRHCSRSNGENGRKYLLEVADFDFRNFEEYSGSGHEEMLDETEIKTMMKLHPQSGDTKG